jgi:hypothetical protein
MPRGRPFQRGAPSPNPSGRPLGARNRSTLAAAALLEGEAEALARKAVELGLKGDMTALRICLDRLLPRCRERPLSVGLPELKSAGDSVKAMAAIAEAVSAGNITLGEASEMVKVVEGFIRAIEVYDLDVRLGFLEAQSSNLREALTANLSASKDLVNDEANETSHRNARDVSFRKRKSSGDTTAHTHND